VYVTKEKLNAAEKMKSREKFLVPYGFKPSSPAKKMYDGIPTALI
jgi:hypothetical protein